MGVMRGEYWRSERRACPLAGMSRRSCRCQGQPRADEKLGKRLRELAGEREVIDRTVSWFRGYLLDDPREPALTSCVRIA
jgi:hypothetical protein